MGLLLPRANKFAFVERKGLVFLIRLVLAFSALMVASMEPVQADPRVPRHVIDTEGSLVLTPIFAVQSIGRAAKQDGSATHVRTAILAIRKRPRPRGGAVRIPCPTFVVGVNGCGFASGSRRIPGDCIRGAGGKSQSQHHGEKSLHPAYHITAFSNLPATTSSAPATHQPNGTRLNLMNGRRTPSITV